jgi:hypothetical protein
LHVSKQASSKFTPFCKSLAEKLLGFFSLSFFFGSLHGSKQANKHAPNSIPFCKRTTYRKPFDFFAAWVEANKQACPKLNTIL